MSCLRDDPNHCAHREGDTTCREEGYGEFCSICAGDNFGCVEQEPQDACHATGASLESSSGSSSGSETGSESSSGPPPACTLEGLLDPSCPEEQPYCIEGACATCDQGPADFCGTLDAATPACHAGWGRCVQCTTGDASACAGVTAWCGNDFTCRGCFEHSHCPDSACDLERGECMDEDVVVHVDNAVCPDAGAGTEAAPYCSVSVGMQQVGTGQRGTVILHGSAVYDEGLLLTGGSPRTIAVIGVDDPSIVVGGTGAAAAASLGMDLYVSDVRLSSVMGTGADCTGSGARMWLDDLSVADNVDGVFVNLCEVRMRRVRITNNEGHGVYVQNQGKVRIESSTIVNGGMEDASVAGVYVDHASIDIRYSTIANNVSALSGANVSCVDTGGGTIRNSIILAPALDSLNCPSGEVFFSVHDSSTAPMGSDNHDLEVFNEAWWRNIAAADYHVQDANSSPFRDRAQWELGDPILDLDGASRPHYPGVRTFAGADEP